MEVKLYHARSHDRAALKDLRTVRDMIRYGTSLFDGADLSYGHGTANGYEDASFIVLEMLSLPMETAEPWLDCALTMAERRAILKLFRRRVETRKPAAYLLRKSYLQGLPFYVDERVIVPRSFIAEILCQGSGDMAFLHDRPIQSVLDLCTGSGCLAILAAHLFPDAHVDAVDLSADALAVARRNVAAHGLDHRITLFEGDLFAPVAGRRYDLILTNPPYVEATAMESLPDEFRHEPFMALAGGEDGMDLVRAILTQAPSHLNPGGGMLCEIGTGRAALLASGLATNLHWLNTAESEGEVFWMAASA